MRRAGIARVAHRRFTFARRRPMAGAMLGERALRAALMMLAPALLLGGAMALGARAAGIAGHNSDAPVHFDADHSELLDKQDRALLVGHVVITQDDLRLTCARGVVAYTSENGGQKIQRFDATGEVDVTRGDENAHGDAGIYDFNQHIITLVGNVVLHRGSDVLRGARLVYDLDSGLARVDGRGVAGAAGSNMHADGQGRVSGTFSVPKKN